MLPHHPLRTRATILAVCLLLPSWSHHVQGVVSLGPFGRAPLSPKTCPSACKVRDISIVGSGAMVAAASADSCINTCKARGVSHYSWAQRGRVCSCGTCSGGYSSLAAGSKIISGSTGACVRTASCSAYLPLASSKACPASSVKTPGKGSKANFYRCCCEAPSPYPVVIAGSLVGCNAYGV